MSLHRAKRFFINRNFSFYFISQSILGTGGFIQTLAITALLVKTTNSGFLTGFSMVCAPLSGVVFSLFAGNFGDRFKIKKYLITIDIIRCFISFQFVFCKSAVSVFMLMLVLSVFDALYSPSKNKLLAIITDKEKLMSANSIISGGYGTIGIAVPVLTGFLVGIYGARQAFLINCFTYLFSALSLSSIKLSKEQCEVSSYIKQSYFNEIQKGIKYCFGIDKLKKSIRTNAVIELCMISINIAFYSLAFDSLKVSSESWGILMSIIYGMNFFAMILFLRFDNWFNKHSKTIVKLLLLSLSAVWLFYSFTNNLLHIYAAEAVEGLSLSICNTLLLTSILKSAKKEYSARVLGIRDFILNISKLIGVGATYIFSIGLNSKFIFKFNAVIMLVYGLYHLIDSKSE